MAVTTTIQIKTDRPHEIRSGSPKNTQMDLNRIMAGLMVSDVSSFECFPNATAGVKASGTLTIDAANVQADDNCTVGVTVFTAKVSPAGAVQFAIGANATAAAANLAATINANTTVSQYCVASASGRIVTITAKCAGIIGNFVALATSGARIVVSAATLASGAGATDVSALSYNL